MSLTEKENLSDFIKNSGATLFDLAANFGTTPEKMAEKLKAFNIPLPSMNTEGPFDYLKNLLSGIKTTEDPIKIIQDYYGGVYLLPKTNKNILTNNFVSVYKNVHGQKVIDMYNGKEVKETEITLVDEDKDNFLVSNLEALSEDTIQKRFSHSLGKVREVFSYKTKYFVIDVEIYKDYDRLVEGTYSPDYMLSLFSTWVGTPLNYVVRNIEEEVFFKSTHPVTIAWWVWAQLSHFAFLKGISSIKVTSTNFIENSSVSMSHSALLSSKDILKTLSSVIIKSQASYMFHNDLVKEIQSNS